MGKRIRLGFAALLPFAVLVAVALIEVRFQRPPLSARPQVWLSKPVDWLFTMTATQLQIVRSIETGSLRFEFVGVSESTSRAKEAGAAPVPVPIQTNVLFTTLADLDVSSIPIELSGTGQGGELARFVVRSEEMFHSESSLKFSGVTVTEGGASDGLEGVVVDNVSISIPVFRDTCEPRESRVFCPLADFSGANLSRGDFELGNLRGVDLTGATMTGAKLGGTDLSGAVLFDVDLSDSWLVAVDINEAFMENVNFTNAVWTR